MLTRGVAAACLLVVLAGCGGGGDQSPGVASAGGTPSSGVAASGGVVAEYVEAVRGFVTCMREAGIDLPDPGPKGQIDYGDNRKLKSDPTFLAAQRTCSGKLPAVPDELEEKPVLTAEQIANTKKYAECMRANGVPEFPDPDPDGHFSGGNWQAGQSEQQAAAALRAGQICEPVQNGGSPTTPDPRATGRG